MTSTRRRRQHAPRHLAPGGRRGLAHELAGRHASLTVAPSGRRGPARELAGRLTSLATVVLMVPAAAAVGGALPPVLGTETLQTAAGGSAGLALWLALKALGAVSRSLRSGVELALLYAVLALFVTMTAAGGQRLAVGILMALVPLVLVIVCWRMRERRWPERMVAGLRWMALLAVASVALASEADAYGRAAPSPDVCIAMWSEV